MGSWLNSLWQTLCQNLVFLMVLVPFFGAGLVLAMSSFGHRLVRRAALSNACLTLALAVLLVAMYDQQLMRSGHLVTIQCTTVLHWAAISGEEKKTALIHFATGADGLNLWFLVSTAAITIPALTIRTPLRRHRGRVASDHSTAEETEIVGTAGYYALLLFTEGMLLVAFSALDVFLFSTSVVISVFPLAVLGGLWGGMERREATRRFVLGHVAGGMLLTAGLLGLVSSNLEREQRTASRPEIAEPSFFLVRTLETPPPPAIVKPRGRQPSIPPFVIVMIAAGTALLTPLAGRHGDWLWFARELPDGPCVMLIGGLLSLGVYVFQRTLSPLTGASDVLAGATPIILVCGNALWLQLHASRRRSSPMMAAILTYACLSCAGGLSHRPGGLAGGVILMLSVALCVPRLATFESTSNSLEGGDGAGRGHWQNVGATLFRAAVSGMPGLGVFAGLWMLLSSLPRGQNAVAAQVAAAVLIAFTLASLVISLTRRSVPRKVDNTRPMPGSEECVHDSERHETSSPDECGALQRSGQIAFAIGLIAIGVVPAFFTNRVLPSCFRTLHQTMPALESAAEPP